MAVDAHITTPQHSRAGRRSPRRLRPAQSPAAVRHSMQRAMWHDPDLNAAVVDQLWSDPEGLLAAEGARMLKDGDRCTVVHVNVGGQPAVMKRYNTKDRMHTALHWLLRSRAMWSWLNAHQLHAAGLNTARPLACVEDRRFGILRERSYLLTAFVPGKPLLELIASENPSEDRLRELARQFADLWQTLGQLRIGHGDMKATNFVIDRHDKLWLVDLDGMRSYRSHALFRRERRNDLARFMRNWQDRPEVAAIFRARIGTG